MDQGKQKREMSRLSSTPERNSDSLPLFPHNGTLRYQSSSQFSQAFKAMAALREVKDLCDVIFIVDGERVYAHRIVLASLSPYFKAMFTGEMAESRQKEITLNGIDLQTLTSLIEYAYTATIDVTEENVQTLLTAASILQFDDVIQVCSDFMRQHLNTENCLGMKAFAEVHGCTKLESAATVFASSHFSEVCQKDEFLDFSSDQLSGILEQDQLNTASEFEVYKSAISWVEQDKEDRKQHIFELLQHIRLPLLSPEELLHQVGHNPLVLGDTKCVELLLEAVQCHLLPETKEKVNPRKLKPRVSHKRLYAIGGWDGNTAVGTVEYYDTETGQWGLTTPTQSPRNGVSLAVLDDKLYAVGGHNGQKFQQSVEVFDPRSGYWQNAAPLKHRRASAGVTTHGGYLYAIGGQDSSVRLKSVERFDPNMGSWQCVASMNMRRDSPGVVGHGDYIYAIGGCHSCMFLDTVEKYDPKTNQWYSVKHMTHRRSAVGAISMGDYIYVFGGHDERNNLCTLERYEPKTDTWTTLSPMNSPRAGVGGAILDGKIVAVGGFDGVEQLNSVEEYDIEADRWHYMSPMKCERSYVGTVAMVKMV